LFLFFRTGDSSVPTSTPQEGGGKTNAKEVRACGHVPSVESPALSVRGFHESVQVSFNFITIDEFIINLIYVFPIEQGKPCKPVTCWVWLMFWCSCERCAITRICLKCDLQSRHFKWRALHSTRRDSCAT